MTCAEVEELIDLYVIGALPAGEAREVAVHLDGCPGCRQIEQRALDVAQLLRLGVDQLDPSPGLHHRLLAVVRESGEAMPARAVRVRTSSWARRLQDWLAPTRAVRLAAGVAVIPLLLSGWLAFEVMELRSEVRSTETALVSSWETSQEAALIMGKAMEHGGAMASLVGTEMAPTASGMLYYAPSEHEAVLVVRGLPELGSGQVYQCWLMSGERRMNAGTLHRENDGRGMLVIRSPMPLDAVEAVNVTEEPHGGSMEPRGERYMWGRLRRV